MRRLLWLLLLGSAAAQNVTMYQGSGAPSGNCGPVQIYADYLNSVFYFCPAAPGMAGTWTQAGGGGGGGTPGGSTGNGQYNAGGGNFGGSSILNFAGGLWTAKAGTNFKFADPTDTTKLMHFDLSNISTGNERTMNVPDANATFAQAITATTHQWLRAMTAQGVFSGSQPACADISDASAFCNGTAYSSLTGTPQLAQTIAAVTHKWVNSYTASTGVFTLLQPACGDLSDATVCNTGTTGSGNVVLATSPTLVTPALGTPSSGNAANMTGYPTVHSLTFQGGTPGGTALTAQILGYATVPIGCTITGWQIEADAGTDTVKTLKVASGTAIPTLGSNSISTSGVALSTGTVIQSTTLTDFTTTTVTALDIVSADLITTSGTGYINFQLTLSCSQ